ncbi:hypothetical protein NMG60_11030504 [Bertholletia excelsa]
MKRGVKVGEGPAPAEKRGSLGEKLKSEAVVGKRGGQQTPVLPPWRFLLLASSSASGRADQDRNNIFQAPPPRLPSVSARKLAATLWELHHYRLPLSATMHHGGAARIHSRRLRRQAVAVDLAHPSPSSPELPGSAGSLRRHVASSLMQHHRSIERNHRAIQPVSPASYGSSMEVGPYNPAVTPSSSLDFKRRIGETSYSLKTSTELLKVMNRIWSLEEQHAANMCLVKALKKELDHARTRIKELVRDQQADKHEIEDLRDQITKDMLVRKGKDQDRISAAIQSVRDELEDERKLRKRSEGLHRKLARELYDIKTSLASALKELERERNTRRLLEDLCDEFAHGIRDYEQEFHALKHKRDKDRADRADHDGLILHISESWLDERMQRKLDDEPSASGNNSVVDKLRSEIETFLRAKRTDNSKSINNLVTRGPNFRRSSLESIPLNAAASAPRDMGDEEDSAGSDLNCFELNKPNIGGLKAREGEPEENQIHDRVIPSHANKNLTSYEKGRSEEQAVRREDGTWLLNTEVCRNVESNPVEASVSRKSEICEVTKEGDYGAKNDGTHGSKANLVIDELLRNQYLLSEARNMHPDDNYGVASSSGNSAWRRPASPVRQWAATLPSQNTEITESSSKLPRDLKDNTLRAKLLEARKRGHRSRSRLKSSKVSF